MQQKACFLSMAGYGHSHWEKTLHMKRPLSLANISLSHRLKKNKKKTGSDLSAICRVHPKNYVTWFMMCCFCFVSVLSDFTHILQGYFTGTGAIKWLPQCQWSNPEEYGVNRPHESTEREIKFIGLFENRGHQGPYSPYKPCNHNLYIGIIIFPHIDNPQSTGYD